MNNLIILFGIVVVTKFIINLSKYITSSRYHKIYNANLDKPDWKIEEIQPQIAKLFRDAGIEDSPVPYVQPVGYDQIIKASVSALENISSTRLDVVHVITTMFLRTKGVYRSRMIDAINPLYWLEFIIFLPKHIFQYLGTSPEKPLVKSVQVIYWVVATVAGFLFGVFQDEINTYVKDFIFGALGIK